MQRIVGTNPEELFPCARPIILNLCDAPPQVTKVVCLERLIVLTRSLIQRRGGCGPGLVLSRDEGLIDRRFEKTGEEKYGQPRSQIHRSQCMMKFHRWSRKNDRNVHQWHKDRRRHQKGSCRRGREAEGAWDPSRLGRRARW